MHARWTVSLAALAAVTLVLAGCVSVPPVPAPSADQAAALARQGDQAGAAQMYQTLANRAAAHNATILRCRRRQAYLAARRPDDAARRPRSSSPPLSAGETFDRSLIQVQVALQRGQAAQAWQLIGAIAVPQQAGRGDTLSAAAAAGRFRGGATGRRR